MKKMIMNRFSIVAAVVSLTCLVSSCNEWLKELSTSQVSDSAMFQTRTGFEDALTGVYIAMAAPEAYGADYTWWINDLVAYPYNSMQADVYRAFQSHLYNTTVSRPIVESMWRGGYFIISNANKLLAELENNGHSVLSDEEFDLIKGELLGIRAYVHFDLSRMFDCHRVDLSTSEILAVPYQTAYGKEPCPQLSYAEFFRNIKEDLAASVDLLARVDPAKVGYSDAFQARVNVNGYWNNRKKHLNYYAAKALQARILLWLCDTKEAAKVAQEVASEALESGFVSWIDADTQLKLYDNDQKDWTFSCEHFFSLEVTDLYSEASRYFFSGGQGQGLTVQTDVVDLSLFINDPISLLSNTSGIEDLRGPAMLLSYIGSGYRVMKLYGSTTQYSAYRNIIPMLKLSEMYYIMAEDRVVSSDNAKALTYFDEVRTHRGITQTIEESGLGLSYLTNAGAIYDFLLNEYYREFLCEGQLIFTLKRFSHQGYQFVAPAFTQYATGTDILRYPYPADEIAYGRIQDKMEKGK